MQRESSDVRWSTVDGYCQVVGGLSCERNCGLRCRSGQRSCTQMDVIGAGDPTCPGRRLTRSMLGGLEETTEQSSFQLVKLLSNYHHALHMTPLAPGDALHGLDYLGVP